MILKFTHGLLNFYESLHDSYWVCTEFTLDPRFFQGENLDSQNWEINLYDVGWLAGRSAGDG